MSELDCELSRLRVDQELREAMREAARRQGITLSAWRKIQYSRAVTEQLGNGWRKPTSQRKEGHGA